MTFRKGEVTNPAGMTPKRLDAAALELVELLASRGSHEVTIAHQVRVSMPTWNRMKARDKRVANALARGRARQHDTLVGALTDQLHKGPVPAIFLLKARFGYRDHGDADGEQRPTVVINLPAAASLAEYQRAITVDTVQPDRQVIDAVTEEKP